MLSYVLKAVEIALGRPLMNSEKHMISMHIAKHKLDPLTSIEIAAKYFVRKFTKLLEQNHVDIDLKEYQIAALGTDNGEAQDIRGSIATEESKLEAIEAEIESVFMAELSSIWDLSKAIVPKSKLQYNYILLDSNNCREITENRTKFSWFIREEIQSPDAGIINVHSKIKNIVAARLASVSMTHQTTAFADQMFARNRLAFGFDELVSQAFISPQNFKFQFIESFPESDRNYGTNFNLSSFGFNRGWFRFREPIKFLERLSLAITNINTGVRYALPETVTQIPAVQQMGTLLPASNVFPAAPNTILIDPRYIPLNYFFGPAGFEFDLPALSGEQVLVSGLNSGNPAVDAAYNGQLRTVQWTGTSNNFVYNGYVVPLFAAGSYNIVLSLIYNPRFMGVLELISEGESTSEKSENTG